MCVDLFKMANGCVVCGYNKHPSALCFDHLEETEKSDLMKNGYSKKACAGGMYRLYTPDVSIEDLINEILKCRLLCVRCHMEKTHANNKRIKTPASLEIKTIEELENQLRSFEFLHEKEDLCESVCTVDQAAERQQQPCG